jgi:gamma-glutamylcyclotransferase (GGCT)/AIG2-like uncharacterized protein YtfP
MVEAERLALYGSLMRGLPDEHGGVTADLLDTLGVRAGLRRIGGCRIPGVLYDLGDYPALRPAERATDLVCGEVHAVLDPRVLEVLDEFEGFDPRDPAGSAYRRECLALADPRGAGAWVYVFNRAPDPEWRIASGDWRAHLAQRATSLHAPGSSRTKGA